MKIKLDENIPHRLKGVLESIGHDVDSVFSEGLTGSTDQKVWLAAQQDGRFFITQDLDFSNSRQFSPGTHHGLLLIRLRTPVREIIFQRLSQVFQEEDVESWSGCFVVISDLKIRVRHPG